MARRSNMSAAVAGLLISLAVLAGPAGAKGPGAEGAVSNPLLAPWKGPHGGVPPFDAVRVDQLAPALEAAMAEKLAEVDAIAGDPAAPTFANTLAALERSGRALQRAYAIYGVYSSAMS